MAPDDPPDETRPDGGDTLPAASADAAASQVGDDAIAATVPLSNGNEIPVALDPDVVEAARDEGVDPSRLADAAAGDVPDDVDFAITASAAKAATDDSATIPVQDSTNVHLNQDIDDDLRFIDDPQIRKLQQNSITYSQRVGRYLLSKDDLIPSVKERIKALIMGSDGLDVDPADPDSEADQRLAGHLEELHAEDVRPNDVVDGILRENLMHARAVLRATDLAELDLSTLDYLKDGISGEEIYIQEPTTVYEFDVEEGSADNPGEVDVEQRRIDSQPLVIGEQVFDISLYDTPPLEAVADTAVNKMVMQRLKARKAELTSFGAVYAKVEPPSYLPEEQYFDRVADDNWDGEGQPPTKLERALRQNMEKAFDHLKEWQSGTTMAIPDYWSLEQIEIPETGTPLDDQIRGYNRSIARRMLVPLDLIELREGAELSRETLFRTLLTTISGWRQEIIRVFEQFARTQAEIHDLNGDVDYSFPPIQNQDEKQIVAALKHAGIAGLTQKEVRQMLNNIEGIDLDISDGPSDPAKQPAPGGPSNPADKTQQMQDFLNEQNERGRTPDAGQEGNGNSGDGSTASAARGTLSTKARNVLERVPFLPTPSEGSKDVKLTEQALKAWLAWKRIGKPSLEAAAEWNPALHPRGPNGQFVERPYDVPDAVQNDIDDMGTADVLSRLVREGAMADDELNALLTDPNVHIDGIPADVTSRQELEQASQDGADGGDSGQTAAQEAMADAGWVTPTAPDLRLSEAEETKPLSDDPDANNGSAAQNMEVAYYDDRKAYVKHFRESLDGPRSAGEKPTNAEREMAADAFLRNLDMGGHLPDQFYHEAERYMSSANVEGDDASVTPPTGADSVDEQAFKRFAAATILAGNSDLHGDNWRVQSDGSFAAIDLGKSGGDFTDPSDFRDRGVSMLMNVSDTLGIDMSRQELQQIAEQLADEIDVDQALAGVENSDISDAARHQFKENIRQNIKAFRKGAVSL